MSEKENWAALVKWLLGFLGINDVWLAQGIGNINIFFLNLVKQRLHDQFIQNWDSMLEESSRATFYMHISSFHFQSYLNDV